MAWNMYDDNDVDIYNSVLMIFIVMNMLEFWSMIWLCSAWCDLSYVDGAMLFDNYGYDDDNYGYDDMMIVYVY